MMGKKILYVDMDNVIVDFESAISLLTDDVQKQYEDRLDEVPHIFSKMQPIEGALQAIEELSKIYDLYILSTAPWENPTAWSDKLLWVKKYLGEVCYKRLIISHHKNLNRGNYLVDDRTEDVK